MNIFHRRASRWLAPLFLVVLSHGAAHAAPPKVDFLFPAGAQRGAMTKVAAQGTFEKWPAQIWCDRSDVKISPAEEKGKLSVAVPADAPPGVCWIRLYDAEGATSLRPFVIGLVPEVAETEPNNEPAKPQVLDSPNVAVNGQLEKTQDVDCFAVALKRGQTFVASMEAHRTIGSPMDGVMQIVSPRGFVLEQNDDDHGLDPQIAFHVPADGTYLVRVMAFPSEPAAKTGLASGANYVYRLTLTTTGFVDHLWPMAASASGTPEAQVFGWNILDSVQRLPLTLVPGQTSVTPFSPLLANFLTIPVVPHAVALETQPAGPHEPQELPFPVTLTGRIAEVRETDHYCMTLKKGEVVNIRLEARNFGSPLDPVLTLADATGKTIQRVDDVQTSRDAELTFTAPADGPFQIAVTDLHRRGDWRSVYRLTVARPQPAFTLSVAADAFTLAPGKPLEIPVTIERTDGFAEEIEISLQGLPASVTAPPVKSLATGDTAKAVKLVLTATPGAFSGPLAISGLSSGNVKQSHKAQFTIAGLAARTTNLWLTVSP